MTNRQRYVMLALAMILVMVAQNAMAQAIGGGGGGLLTTVIQWFMTNIVQGIIMIAIIVIGVTMMVGRHTFAGIIVVIGGILVVANYNTIVGLIPMGG